MTRNRCGTSLLSYTVCWDGVPQCSILTSRPQPFHKVATVSVTLQKSLYDAFVAEETADGYRLNQTIITYKQLESLGISLRDGNIMVGNEGYFSWKYRALKEDCMYDNPGLQFYQYINLRFMRYAEVLLMAAEAHVQAGSGQDKALNYINEIRQRAQLAPLSTVTLDDIKTEKRLELCMEGVRYQDLIRWGDAEEVLKEQGHYVPSLVMDKKYPKNRL